MQANSWQTRGCRKAAGSRPDPDRIATLHNLEAVAGSAPGRKAFWAVIPSSASGLGGWVEVFARSAAVDLRSDLSLRVRIKSLGSALLVVGRPWRKQPREAELPG